MDAQSDRLIEAVLLSTLNRFEADEWENFPDFTLNYLMLSKGKCSKGRSNYLSNYSPALKRGAGYIGFGLPDRSFAHHNFFISAKYLENSFIEVIQILYVH